jgi:branched-chain amino acid aminotransferase
MAVARWFDGRWEEPRLGPLAPLALHPGAHVLHYASACFEGLKAHRGVDGAVRIFRLDGHVARMRESARLLCLPAPDPLEDMVLRQVAAARDDVPPAPGSLYIRPVLIGTEANIGAAGSPSAEALLYVVTCPVGDYFSGGIRPLRLLVEEQHPRSTPEFGMAKAGGNYAASLRTVVAAKRAVGADQVLFAPGGDVQETGASNFLLIDARRVITKPLDGSFLHGITRDSVLRLAADLGYAVEERAITVAELLEWAARPDAEAALSGTAAVLAPVGTLVHEGSEHRVGSGGAGPHTLRLRSALTDIHAGAAPDPYGWLRPV